MFDQTLTLENVFYLLFGLVGLGSALFAVYRGISQDQQAHSHRAEDEAIRIVRMDENIKQVTAGISDIKAEMRSTKKILDDHERRVLKLELDNVTQWRKIDELKEAAKDDGKAREEQEA